MTNDKLTFDKLISIAESQFHKRDKIPTKFKLRLENQIQAILHAYEIKLINHAEAIEDAMTAGKVTAFDIKREENEAKR